MIPHTTSPPLGCDRRRADRSQRVRAMLSNLSDTGPPVKPPDAPRALRKVAHGLYQDRCYKHYRRLRPVTSAAERETVAFISRMACRWDSYATHDGFAFVSADAIVREFRISPRAAWSRIAQVKACGLFEVIDGGGRNRANKFRPVDPVTKRPLLFREVEAVEEGRIVGAAFSAGLDVDRVEAFAAFWAAHGHPYNPEKTARAYAAALKAGADPAQFRAAAEAWAEVEGCAPSYTWLERRHYEKKPRVTAAKQRRRRRLQDRGRRDPLYVKAVKLGRAFAAAIKGQIVDARGAERRAIEAVLDKYLRLLPTLPKPLTADDARGWFQREVRENLATERGARIESGVA